MVLDAKIRQCPIGVCTHMKVLILGGTGAMGAHLVSLLSNDRVATVVTSRAHRHSWKNVRYVQGNAHDVEFLQTVLQEHWDAIVDFMVYTTVEFEKRVDLMLGATSHYVFLSSSRVYAESAIPITEASPRLLDVSSDEKFLATDDYALTKARQEDLLRDSGRANWTIIRPYLTYSENRLQLGVLEKEGWLYRALQGRTIVCSSDINSRITTMTNGLDVSKGIVAIIGNRDALGEAFHITTENSVTWNDVLSIYLSVLEQHLGRRPTVLLQDLDTFTKCSHARWRIAYDRLFNRQFDNAKISKYVDTSGFVRIEDGLTSCLERFLQNPTFKHINWGGEGKTDRQTKERAAFRKIKGCSNRLRYLKHRYF